MQKMKNGHHRYISGQLGKKILNTPKNRFFLRVLPEDKNGCMLWIGSIKKNGYGFFGIDGKNIHVHRFSYEYHYKVKIPKGENVCHKCDNRNCVAPKHLFLGTQKDNVRDMIKKKRDYWSKYKILTDKQRLEIYNKIKKGYKIKDLVLEYKISKSTCYKIFYHKEEQNEKQT